MNRGQEICTDEETMDGIRAFGAEQAHMWLTLGERYSKSYEKGLTVISQAVVLPNLHELVAVEDRDEAMDVDRHR